MSETKPWGRWKGHDIIFEGNPKENDSCILRGDIVHICELDDELTSRQKGHYAKRILSVPKLEAENARLQAEVARLALTLQELQARTPATATPGPAPGPRGDVEAAFWEWSKERWSSEWYELEGVERDNFEWFSAFKAGAEWRDKASAGSRVTGAAEHLLDMWRNGLDIDIAAGNLERALAETTHRYSPEVQAVLDCARVLNARIEEVGMVISPLADQLNPLYHAVRDLERVEAGREKGGSDG